MTAGTGEAHRSPRHAARGILQGVVGRGLSFGCAYLATIILARKLGPEDYGTYGMVISVLLWIEQTGRFTIPPAAAKLIPEQHERAGAIQEAALIICLVLFTALGALLWLAATPLASLFDIGDEGARLFRVAALDLPIFGAYSVYRGVLQGHHEFLALSISDVIYAAGKLAAVIVLLASLTLPGALLTNIAASAAALLYVGLRTPIRVGRPASHIVRLLVRLALPLGVYMLMLQTITNLDLWSLKVFASTDDAATIGRYVAARNLAVVPGVVLMVVSDILLPSLSRALAANDVRASRMYIQGAVRFVSISMAPIVLILMVGADDFMALLYSGEFRPAGAYVRILVLYAVSLPFVDLFASALSASGKPYRGGVTLLSVIPVIVFLNVVLVGRYGAIGAAYGSALAGGLCTMALGIMVINRFGALMTPRTLINIVAAMLLMATAAHYASVYALPAWTYVGCLAIYGLALIALREIGRDDLAPLAFWKWGLR